MSQRQRHVLARIREGQIVKLLEEGRTTRDIAAEIGISQPGVVKAMRRIEARVLDEMSDTVQTTKARQLIRLERIYREAFEQWARSKTDRTTRIRKQVDTSDGPRNAAEVKTTDGLGDPRFLAEARGALADQRKILGLDRTVVEHEMAKPDRPAEHLTDAELDAQIIQLAMARQRKAGGGDQPH